MLKLKTWYYENKPQAHFSIFKSLLKNIGGFFIPIILSYTKKKFKVALEKYITRQKNFHFSSYLIADNFELPNNIVEYGVTTIVFEKYDELKEI